MTIEQAYQILKRDKTGRFLPIGEKAKPKLKFKDKFVSKKEVKEKIADAYLDGFQNAKRLKNTVSASESLQAYMKLIQ